MVRSNQRHPEPSLLPAWLPAKIAGIKYRPRFHQFHTTAVMNNICQIYGGCPAVQRYRLQSWPCGLAGYILMWDMLYVSTVRCGNSMAGYVILIGLTGW